MTDLASQLAGTGKVHAGLAHQGPTVTKSQANYRPAEKPNQSCKDCEHFDGKTSCEIVAGHIQPDHVSDHFKPKGGHGTGSPGTEHQPDSGKHSKSSSGPGGVNSGQDAESMAQDSGKGQSKDEGLY